MSGVPPEEWLHFELEPDEEHPERGPDGALLDTAMRLGGRDNRVGLWRGPASWKSEPGAERAVVDLQLRCVAHAHPECRFHWVRLVADFAAANGKILDLSPRRATADEAARGELPEIVSSGIGFPSVTWDFRARHGQAIHVDRDLRLLVSLPAAQAETPLQVRYVVRASVVVNGVAGLIPLIGRRTSDYYATDRGD